ncbi:hypothetical protein LAUMK4_00026 [Mycobacterium persicum]|uniref:Uncharacterized protein n=1 Tax=Mycobacterium persicum TaxID=1487726 RepID=A0AB38ULM2_9MYCO|nr:hypothetical protein LAUMK15_00376 [Mycobacterium persicum]VAZ81422.1 hypothetical protein LAUMK42_00223 [Mycobacterium persicum]VAZ86785.1 hypothetical protein LAUMK4_00026 [Mycobacterium persicum]
MAGSPKHLFSLNPDHAERNHATNRTSTRFPSPHTAARVLVPHQPRPASTTLTMTSTTATTR